MRILVTNDDGVHAPGIIALACTLAEIGQVRVVAPDRERSAAGHSITLHRPLRMGPVRLPEYAKCGIEAFATSGTPSDCVILAVHEVYGGELPDLVVSGINSGPNVGDDVTYSGTVMGALEGALVGIPAIAASMGWFDNKVYYWDAARVLAALIGAGIELPAPGQLWNVNLPNLPLDDYLGLEITRLGHRTFKDSPQKRLDPKGEPYWWIAGDEFQGDPEEGTDTWALKQSKVSLTPLSPDLTNYKARQALLPQAPGFAAALEAIEGFISPGPNAAMLPWASVKEPGAE